MDSIEKVTENKLIIKVLGLLWNIEHFLPFNSNTLHYTIREILALHRSYNHKQRFKYHVFDENCYSYFAAKQTVSFPYFLALISVDLI